jgi:hypothetical protein
MDRLSKIVDYLIDNLHTNILSWVECESQRKAVGRVIWFQFGNSGTAPNVILRQVPRRPPFPQRTLKEWDTQSYVCDLES